MTGKVFISCGQATKQERSFAKTISESLANEGFTPYVAIEAQSIQDVNTEIVEKLKRADYYIFIDFRKEHLSEWFWNRKYRGSLFTNQELAIAYTLDFDHTLFFQQKGVRLEGVGKYILSNAHPFKSYSDLISTIKAKIKKLEWSPKYSRHLIAKNIRSFRNILYRDHSLHEPQKRTIFHVNLENHRHDMVAVNVIAHLINVTKNNESIQGYADKCDLKWALQQGYTRNIAPRDVVPFDAFAIEEHKPTNVYLHSLSDTYPRNPIITEGGIYFLQYEIYSENFPVLRFTVKLNLTDQIETTTAELVRE